MRPLVLFSLTASLANAAVAEQPPQVLLSWEFDKPGDVLGWRSNSQVEKTTVANGALHVSATGHDPFLTSPMFDLPAGARQPVREGEVVIEMAPHSLASIELPDLRAAMP